MSTILFAWELGGGLGHSLQILPLAEELARRGHRVAVALRYLTASPAFARRGIPYFAAPILPPGRPAPFPRVAGFAHLLADIGWGDDRTLAGLAAGWRSLFRLARPDLVVFDHSPTALLASRGLPTRRALLGLGFFCPPDTEPLPALRDVPEAAPDCLPADERTILGRANRLLDAWKQPPLPRLGRLYAEVDENFLATFPELDHFGPRDGVRYWGPINGPGGGQPVQWPSGEGKKIYAYLKRFPTLPALLEALNQRKHPTVVFADGIDAATRDRFASDTLRFETQPLDLAQVGRECDLAIHNANHGTLSQLLLAGRPMLQLPITLEQVVLAKVVERTGAAETVSAHRGTAEEIGRNLDVLLADPRYAHAAALFARRHADFNPVPQRHEMIDRLEEVLSRAPAIPT